MIPLLDTHQHLIFRDRLTYAWTRNVDALKDRDFTVDDYQKLTGDKAVSGTLFMEVDADEYHEEARYISELASTPGNNILGLIASCRPEDQTAFDEWLEESADLPIVGFRRILHEISDELSTTDTFRANIRKLGSRSKTFDMVFRQDQLAIAHDLAAACDNVTLILDHCGVPDIVGGNFDNWKHAISRIASLPHVNGKISGIMAYCGPDQAGLETIRPYVLHMIDSFSPERLVWGSDWPVVNITSSLPQWIDIFRQLISDLSIGEQEAICHANARKIYNVNG